MRVAGIREFRERVREFLSEDDLVFLTRHGRLSGLVVPLKDPQSLPLELRRELLEHLGKAISAHLTKRGVSERKVIRDFEAWRKQRRKGRRRR